MWAWWVALLLFLSHLCLSGSQGGEGGGGQEEVPAHKRQSVQYSTLVGPSFVNTSLHAHTHALIGQTAYLTCVVRNLHNYTVSWVRARDIHLLTAGETTYTSDHRFVAVNPGSGGRWVLRLHHARPSDAGTYLCQVSVSPPISSPVTLLVTEAVAMVKPGREVFLKEGSQVVLVCEVRGCPYPALPTWYRARQVQQGTELYEGQVEGSASPTATTTTTSDPPPHSTTTTTTTQHPHLNLNIISFTSARPSTSEPGPAALTSTLPTTTPTPIGLPIARVTLTRPKASSAHSGLYTCTNTCTEPVNLTLHVLTGDEETAAMQHLSGSLKLLPAGCVRLVVASLAWCKLMS
ncbi:uncharacterized protein [Panulirus ornatus]|uniref:uncharacterized protein n=1 Tax=Panulirus ornatus TaxID=150431 RepID=UPI003A854838